MYVVPPHDHAAHPTSLCYMQWPHNVGPIMHYMTECTGSCSSYDSTNAEWFKISQLGLETGSTWYQANIGLPFSHSRAFRVISSLYSG